MTKKDLFVPSGFQMLPQSSMLVNLNQCCICNILYDTLKHVLLQPRVAQSMCNALPHFPTGRKIFVSPKPSSSTSFKSHLTFQLLMDQLRQALPPSSMIHTHTHTHTQNLLALSGLAGKPLNYLITSEGLDPSRFCLEAARDLLNKNCSISKTSTFFHSTVYAFLISFKIN